MVTEKLCGNNIHAASYHARMDADERAWVQKAFQRDDLQIVKATVALNMGLINPTCALWCNLIFHATLNPTIRKLAAQGVMVCLLKP